ncbi:hypothetical protein ACFFP0_07480 [Rhizobium puerariae]|uniref:TIR domain-containing protein n=1 Tax=Rhizobium puerariae TaxID=1585791 RepID=A0ABV6AF27_9HYPH
MSLVLAWSNTYTIASETEAIIQYALFRLELDGHTTAILDPDADDEAYLVSEADAVVVLADALEGGWQDERLNLVPSTAPVLLLSTENPPPGKLNEIVDHPTVFAKIDLEDLSINECGASFTGKTELELRNAIRQLASLLQRTPFQGDIADLRERRAPRLSP